MALLVLIVLGATVGWLASILARTEAPGQILRQMATGVAVSLLAGLLLNDGTMLGSLSFVALGAAVAASTPGRTVWPPVRPATTARPTGC